MSEHPNIQKLLSRLLGVKETANGEWVALCPAHNDRSPSLSVKDNGDGRILIHCFAECSPNDVVESVGMSIDELMPPNDGPPNQFMRKLRFNPLTVLEAMRTDVLIVSLFASDMAQDKKLTIEEKDRLWEISGKLDSFCKEVKHVFSGDRPLIEGTEHVHRFQRKHR